MIDAAGAETDLTAAAMANAALSVRTAGTAASNAANAAIKDAKTATMVSARTDVAIMASRVIAARKGGATPMVAADKANGVQMAAMAGVATPMVAADKANGVQMAAMADVVTPMAVVEMDAARIVVPTDAVTPMAAVEMDAARIVVPTDAVTLTAAVETDAARIVVPTDAVTPIVVVETAAVRIAVMIDVLMDAARIVAMIDVLMGGGTIAVLTDVTVIVALITVGTIAVLTDVTVVQDPIAIRPDIMGAISGMAMGRATVMAIIARSTVFSITKTGIIRLAGSMRILDGTIIHPVISAIAMWFRRIFIGAAADIGKSRCFATTAMAMAILSRAVAAFTAIINLSPLNENAGAGYSAPVFLRPEAMAVCIDQSTRL